MGFSKHFVFLLNMDLSESFDDYENNVIDILNNGFKMLIDNLNETLNILFQSTLVSVAENVENGIKSEFQSLVGVISEELNVKNNNTASAKDVPLVSSNAKPKADLKYVP